MNLFCLENENPHQRQNSYFEIMHLQIEYTQCEHMRHLSMNLFCLENEDLQLSVSCTKCWIQVQMKRVAIVDWDDCVIGNDFLC